MTRSIQIYCTQFGPTPKSVTVTDGVTTLQDLKNQADISGNNWTAMGRPSKTPYVFAKDGTSAQIINSEDVTISFYPVEMKAGSTSQELSEMKTELEALENILSRLFDRITDVQENVSDMLSDLSDNDISSSSNGLEMDEYTRKMLGN